MALDFLAGCLGGCAGVIVGHPFDTVKVRLQTQDAKNPLYRGTFHCIGTIVKKESVKGLFKGMSSPMAGLSFINAIVFGVYGNMQRYLPEPDAIVSHTISGCTAGFVQCLVTSPMEMTKIRMQIQGLESESTSKSPARALKAYKSPMDCLMKVHRQEGLRGVYRGLGITALRDTPGFGSYFASYEFLTRKVFADANGDVSTAGLFVAGGLAGIISWIVCYPLDVIKSRYQADGFSGTKKQYINVMDCVRKSYKEEGGRVFFKGFNTTIIRAFPVNAATFTVVAYVLKFFGEDARPVEAHQDVSVKRVSGTMDCI